MRYMLILLLALTAQGQSIFRNGSLANMTVVTPAAAPSSPTPDILWYKFSEGSGTSVADDVGSNDLTATNVTWVTGASGSGYAIKKAAVAGIAASTSAAITHGTNDYTVCAWYKFADYNDQTVWGFNRSDASEAICSVEVTYSSIGAFIRGWSKVYVRTIR